MRCFDIENILPKKYSIKSNQIIEQKDNAEYFSYEIAKLILLSTKHNDLDNVEKLKKKDKKEHEKAVKNYCSNYSKKINAPKELSLTKKQYEIFTLNIVVDTYYLFLKDDLPQCEKTDKVEDFYLLENAKLALEIYNDKSYSETIDMENIETDFDERLNAVYEYDNSELSKSLDIYCQIKNTDFYKNAILLNSEKTKILEENNKLKQDLSTQKDKVKELQSKLKKALDEIEKERNEEKVPENKLFEIFKKKKTNK